MCPVCGYDRALAKNLRLEYAEKTLDVLEKYGAADKPRQSAASVVGFILGLASFFCGCNIILAIMAIAFSCESGQNLTTRKNAFSRAGQILGVISIILFVHRADPILCRAYRHLQLHTLINKEKSAITNVPAKAGTFVILDLKDPAPHI